MHRVYVPGARPPSVVVTGGDAHHMTRVLRLSAGDGVAVFDGQGREWSGRLGSTARSGVTIDLTGERTPAAEPPVHLTLGIAVLKGPQLDHVVREATALGASAIAPFVSTHVAVSERAWKHRSVDRWRRVAEASASQCGRAVVPEIRGVSAFDALVASTNDDAIVVCAEPAAGPAQPVTSLPRPPRALLLIGPEGGWAADELQRVRSAGAAFVSLGPRTLRAETAPTVALAALWTHWGWA